MLAIFHNDEVDSDILYLYFYGILNLLLIYRTYFFSHCFVVCVLCLSMTVILIYIVLVISVFFHIQ